jgi:hypothetical protein
MLRAVLVTHSLPRFLSGHSSPVLSVRAPSRLMSTENFATPSPPFKPSSTENLTSPTPLVQLIEQLVPTAAFITIVVTVAGAASYVYGVLTKLEERIAGVIKEVDAKIVGAKETIDKEVNAKMAGAKETIDKEVNAKNAGLEKSVDNKIAGFREAADLKYSSKSNKWW